MKQLRLSLLVLALVSLGACSHKSDRHAAKEEQEEHDRSQNRSGGAEKESAERKHEEQGEEGEKHPAEDEIVEDCVGFLQSTVAVPPGASAAHGECPTCPTTADTVQVLKFESAEVDRVIRGDTSCEAEVKIRATFNPSKGGTISGGLTGWIPVEQRERYSRGETPSGDQFYTVKIAYRRRGNSWRAVEFY